MNAFRAPWALSFLIFIFPAAAEERTVKEMVIDTATKEPLEPNLPGNDEMVATGRASAVERKNHATAVSTVKGDDLTTAPAETVDQALQGKVVGASFQTNDGAPGGGVRVRLRGVSSISAESEPLYVVDGMIVSNVSIPWGFSAPVNRIADLNPSDIETIEVMKGASAAAIYGSKGSNGVIIITTKRGQRGRLRIDVTQRYGYSSIAKKLGSRTFGSSGEVLDAFCPADKTGQRDPNCVAGVPSFYKPGVAYDHDAELAGQSFNLTTPTTETIVSAGGSTEGTQYFFSGLVRHDAGVITNTGYDKQSLRANLGQDLSDRWHVNVNTNLVHSLARRGITEGEASFYTALASTPNFVDLRRRPDGTFPVNPAYSSNPLATAALATNGERVWRFIGSADSRYRFWESESQQLSLTVNGGIDRFQLGNSLRFPPELNIPPGNPSGTSLSGTATNLNLNLGVNLAHTFTAPSGLFSTTTTAGAQYESRDLDIERIIGSGALNMTQQHETVRDRGAYLQEEAVLLDRRLALAAAIRGEQSSANDSSDNLYWYPKASVAYRFLELVKGLDELKLRLAYGEAGNQPLYAQRFVPANNIGGNPGGIGNPNVRPERQREIEGGADVRFFGGKALLELTGYQRLISPLLVARALPPSTGFSSQFFNGGVLRSRGIEIALGATPFLSESFQWQLRTSFAKNASTITSLPVPAFTVVGGFGAQLGDYRIEQGASATQIVGNDGLKPDGTCCIVDKIGDAEPNFLLHFSNRLSWHGLTLFFLLDWQNGGSIIDLTRLLYDLSQNSVDYVSGGKTRLAQWLNSARPYIESGSFLKLREITLSYDFSAAAVSRLWGPAKRLRVSVSARNLLTFTSYSGMDPEFSQPGFRNLDATPYPPSRTFWTSVEMSFM